MALALASGAEAQDRGSVRPLDLDALAAPSFEAFTSRDGLPDGVVTTVGVDARGFAWATSPKGLYRFYGHGWKREVGPEWGGVHRRVMLDAEGRFWVPSQDRGIMRLQDGRWQHFGREDGLPTDHVYAIVETSGDDGTPAIAMLTIDAGLWWLRGDSWIPDPGNGSLPKGQLLSFGWSRELFGGPRQWIGTLDHGLLYRPHGEDTWRLADVEGFPGGGQIEAIRSSRDAEGESLWVSIFGNGLWRIREDGLRHWSLASGELRSDEAYTLALSRGDEDTETLWMATRDGLVQVRGDSAVILDRRHGLPSDQIRSNQVWRGPGGEEVLWIATEGGAARAVLGAEGWRTVSLMGSGALGVFGVEVEPDGRGGERLWVASVRDGLGLYENGRWRRFTTGDGALPTDTFRLVRRVPDLEGEQVVWAGGLGGDLVRIDDGPRFSVVPTPWPKNPVQVVMDVLGRSVSGRRELWFATRMSGVYRWAAGGWTRFAAQDVARDVGPELDEWWTTALAEQVDGSGRSWVWVTSNQGLARFDGEGWRLLRAVPDLPDNRLLGLDLETRSDGRQVLWVGSAFQGMTRLDVTDPMDPFVLPPGDLPPAIDQMVYSAKHDQMGRIYLCTNVGVQQLTPRPDGGWDERVFGRRDGMVHEECNTNAQFLDRHGRFWTGTLGGLTVFDPTRSRPGRTGQLRLLEVRINGGRVDPSNLVVPAGRFQLRVEFTLQSLQREEETRYRTQVLGVDPAPGPWTVENNRTLAALPPGEHVLRIEARNWAGAEAWPLEIPLRVKPAWWQRRGAQLALVLAAVLLAVLAAQLRTLQLRRRTQQLEAVVESRTEALNVANERLRELSYTDALTGLANRRRLLEDLHALAARGDGAPCGLVFIDCDHFKAYNDRLGHPAGDEALRVVAASLVARAPEGSLVARYGGEEFACLLPGMDIEEAADLAERMRIEVERRSVPVPGSENWERVTISAGVATVELHREQDLHRLLREADLALYAAKRAGRNRVCRGESVSVD